ncbi:MAG TPA: hypothetical protein ENK23_03025 [Sorangium sp.]|nr:hypothetical protein [Sorangium sp.]
MKVRVGWLAAAVWLVPLWAAACTPEFEDCQQPGDEDENGYADCDDRACWVVGGGCQEVCDSTFDEDADGAYGCFDDDCWVAGGSCKEVCGSGFDEDGDGSSDCDDSDCWVKGGACQEVCASEQDEDGDGFAGCLDDDCWYADGPCAEACSGLNDEDGDGLFDCDDPDCLDAEVCIPTFNADVQPIFLVHCSKAGCHEGDVPAAGMSVQRYDDMLKPSYYCANMGLTKGACTIVRILDGSMPAGGATLPQEQIDTVQRWVDGGILP